MRISKEHFLSLKISAALLAIFALIFGVLLYSNFVRSIDEEKQKFVDNIGLIPTHHLLSVITGTESDLEGSPRKKVERVMGNIYIEIKGISVTTKGLFNYTDFGEKGFDAFPEKEVFLWSNGEEKILLFKRENNKVTFVIGKNIDFIHEGLVRLLYISLILGVFSIIVIYAFSLKMARKTFSAMREVNKKLKDYNHNVAHELKTPLAIMKSNLELLELSANCDNALLQSSHEEIMEMQNIIDAILFLSEYKAKYQGLEKQKINLSKYVEKYLDKNLKDEEFSITIPSETRIRVNKKLFKRLLKNVFENVIKYKKIETEVFITASKKKGKTILIVKNEIGDTLRLDHGTNLFENFTQADNSRNSSGYGLGLSIVKKICELHGWEVGIEIKEGIFILKIEM